MTEKLKTLKDIEGILKGEVVYVNYKNLKQEAIKWAKAFREKNCEPPFMEFHNIKEEDLI